VAEDTPDIGALERIAADCWPAAEIETLAGWRLGFMEGVTRRANSVLPLGWSGALDLEGSIDRVEARYRARKLPPVFKLTRTSRPGGLPAALAARGYADEGYSDVLARRADGFLEPTAARGAHAVRLLDTPAPEWCALSFAGRPPCEAAVLAAMASRLAAPRAFALVETEGAPACAGFAALSDGWAAIAGVHTLDAARRKGAARALMAALARWSVAAGAPMLVLQVERSNAAAGALYRGLGFERLYGYHYSVARG
jgi:N-acetylglutamate synthase